MKVGGGLSAPPAFNPTSMQYYVTLEQNFIDIRTFKQGITNTGISLPAGLISNAPSPFFLGGTLHYPVTVGLNNPAANGVGGIIGFLKAKIANGLGLGDVEHKVIDSPEALKQAGVKLSAQSIKMLKTLRANNKVFANDSYHSNRGFKCRAEEVIKCLTFGYFNFPDDRSFMETLTQNDYNIHAYVSDKRNSIAAASAELVKYFNNNERTHWNNRSVGARISKDMVRTVLAPDEECVVKWRKPSKNSKWPYTLDHHWFCCQESPVAMAHHTMASLMSRGEGRSNRDQLMLNLPIFLHIRALEICRKIMENFFTNLPEILKTHSSAMGEYSRMVHEFEWPNGRYSSRKVAPEMFPIKAALALGVLPKFDDSGKFDRFIPINGTLHDNPKTIYLEMDTEYLQRRRSEQSMLLMYSTGLISLEDLEKILGPISHNEQQLRDNSEKVQLRMSRNVVCCLPVESANASVYATLARYGITKATTKDVNDELASMDPDVLLESIQCGDE